MHEQPMNKCQELSNEDKERAKSRSPRRALEDFYQVFSVVFSDKFYPIRKCRVFFLPFLKTVFDFSDLAEQPQTLFMIIMTWPRIVVRFTRVLDLQEACE